MRKSTTGAIRDLDDGKYDYDGFLSPLVIKEFGRYMHEHRILKDGTMRDSDNWQKGFGEGVSRKSLWRHFMDLWSIDRGYKVKDHDGKVVSFEDACCAVIFNTQEMLHSHLEKKLKQ